MFFAEHPVLKERKTGLLDGDDPRDDREPTGAGGLVLAEQCLERNDPGDDQKPIGASSLKEIQFSK